LKQEKKTTEKSQTQKELFIYIKIHAAKWSNCKICIFSTCYV